MKAPWRELLLFWFCDTFGHAREDCRTAAWEHNGSSKYQCARCGRIVSRRLP